MHLPHRGYYAFTHTFHSTHDCCGPIFAHGKTSSSQTTQAASHHVRSLQIQATETTVVQYFSIFPDRRVASDPVFA